MEHREILSPCITWAFRIDSEGNVLWSRIYNISGIFNSSAYDLVQDENGDFLLAGWARYDSSDTFDDQILLIKANSSGETIWEVVIGEESLRETAYAAEGTSDNGYILAGDSGPEDGETDILLVKTDSLGNVEWQENFGGTAYEWATSVHQTADGGYILAGTTNSSGNPSSGILIKTDSTGGIEWQRAIIHSRNVWLWDAQQTVDGGFVGICNKEYIGGARSANILWFDASGNILHQSVFATSSAKAMIQTADKGVIVVGEQEDCFWMVRADSLGNTVWNISIPPAYSGCLGTAICCNSDGGYLVSSERFESTGEDYDCSRRS